MERSIRIAWGETPTRLGAAECRQLFGRWVDEVREALVHGCQVGIYGLEFRIGEPGIDDGERRGVPCGDLGVGEGGVFGEQVVGDGEVGIRIDSGEGGQFGAGAGGIEEVVADELLLGWVTQVGTGDQVGQHFRAGLAEVWPRGELLDHCGWLTESEAVQSEERRMGERRALRHAVDDETRQQVRGSCGARVDENIERFEESDGGIDSPVGIADQLLGLGAEKVIAFGSGISAGIVAEADGPFVGGCGGGEDLFGNDSGLLRVDFAEPVEQGDAKAWLPAEGTVVTDGKFKVCGAVRRWIRQEFRDRCSGKIAWN